MTLIAWPLIAADDYAEFQRLIPELQIKPYGQWQNEQHCGMASRRELGYTVASISVSPGDFEFWLMGTRKTANLASLLRFAEDRSFSISQPAQIRHDYDLLERH